MKFTELTIHTLTEGSELVADILWNYTNYGVSICDVKDIVALLDDDRVIYDYVDESITTSIQENSCVLVKCYIPLGTSPQTVKLIREDLEILRERAEGGIVLGTLEMITRVIEGDDWIDIWKKHFKPIHIGNIVICPEWITCEPTDDEHIIKLDSNMAFGTGEHETTSMCLELMQKYQKKNDVVIDVGCGSGILGIAGIKLGASIAYLTDIDYVAIKSAEHNSVLNGTSHKTNIMLSNLLDNTVIKGDLVVANIMAEILCGLSNDISKNLKDSGVLILSGIINSKKQMVLDAYSVVGLKLIDSLNKGEWNALVLKY